MQIFLRTVSLYWEANILTSDNGVLVLFGFLKTMFGLGHQPPFYTFGYKKEVPINCTNIVIYKRQNKLSEPIGWSILHTQKRAIFFRRKRWVVSTE